MPTDAKMKSKGRSKPLANPQITKLKQERKDTAHSDSDVDGGKAGSLKSASVQKRNIGHIQLENTYKLGPDEEQRFIEYKARNTAQEVLNTIMEDQVYDPKIIPKLAKSIVDHIKEKTKDLKMPRHKIVVHAVIGEKGNHSLKSASRCLWNDKYDSYTSVEYSNSHMFALVTIYAIYFD